MPHLVAPSILAADFLNLNEGIILCNNSKADWIHVDVMDGHFVPNLSFGIPVIKAVKRIAEKPLDVHLMITNPEKYIADYRNAGADHITVHYEVCPDLGQTLSNIKALGAKAGVAINPKTPVSVLKDVISQIDIVCMMSVNPGFGGQSFITHVMDKVKELRKIIDEAGVSTLIEIDGGVTKENAREIVHAGCDVLVAGSTVYKANDPEQTIADLKSLT